MKEGIPHIELFTDGGAEPNPGRGGYGFILKYKNTKREFSQGFCLTTNNRMELMAVIAGLSKINRKSEVIVFSDSKYVIDGITKGWAKKWQSNNWKRNKNELAKNADLWAALLSVLEKHDVQFCWVKGHSGHEENERCDTLAGIALKGNNLIEDTGYEPEELLEPKPEAYVKKEPSTKRKILNEGDECRKCLHSVVLKPTKNKKLKQGQSYYFDYYLICPGCGTMYMVEAAKRYVDKK
jgi:ribonuclease HI